MGLVPIGSKDSLFKGCRLGYRTFYWEGKKNKSSVICLLVCQMILLKCCTLDVNYGQLDREASLICPSLNRSARSLLVAIMARILMVVVVLAMMAVSSHAQVLPRTIYFNRTRISRYFDGVFDDGNQGDAVEKANAKPGKGLAVVYSIVTVGASTLAGQKTTGPAGCTGKLYQTATYATVDITDTTWETTYANYELSLQLDDCPGNPTVEKPYKKGAIFAAGLGTAIAAKSSLPKAVYGGFNKDSFRKVAAGYLERNDNGIPAQYTISFR